jgi:hypothetical protein
MKWVTKWLPYTLLPKTAALERKYGLKKGDYNS